jgi:hypothetical protein
MEHGFVGWCVLAGIVMLCASFVAPIPAVPFPLCRFLTSAKANVNIEESVMFLVRSILQHEDAFEEQRRAHAAQRDEEGRVDLTAAGRKESAEGSCCG